MKKLNLLFTALLLMCCVGNAKAEEVTINGIKYDVITKAKQATVISGDTKYSGDIVIPSKITYNNVTCSVTSIGEDAFEYCSRLTSITIPNSVTSIGAWAFGWCDGLTSVTIGNSVTSIGKMAFHNCSSLTSITIPNSVTSIGNRAFDHCYGLTSATIGNSVTSIGEQAFEHCTGLTSVTIGNSVTSIGNNAFCGCTSLTSITIPNSVTSIGNNAFISCSGLTSATIGNSVTSIGKGAFWGCSGLTSITIPNSVTSIGYQAFEDCTGLTSITIPNSVTSIGDYAFEDCTGLTSITIPNSVTSIGYQAFYNCKGLTSVTIGNSVTSIGSSAFEDCDGLKTVYNFSNLTFAKGSTNYGYIAYYADKVYNVPNGSIEGDYIFCKPNNVNTLVCYLGSETELTLPADYKGESYAIGESAFKGNNTITSITIPNSVTSIEKWAFRDCTKLTNATIGDNVTYIGEGAFGFTGLKSITIPNSVKTIGIWAFEDCYNLTSITIPNSVTSIGDNAFIRCTGLTSITIPNSVTSIGESAFSGCYGLKEVHINDIVAWCSINFGGDYANPLYYAHNLYLNNELITELVIPNSVTSIGNYAFESCDGLTSITIPNSVTSIEKWAFRDCTKLTNATIGDNVTYIGEGAFGFTGLKSITIPNSVKTIGIWAFEDCYNLTSITIPNSVTSIGDNAFIRCTGLTSITIPNSVTSIGESAFSGCYGLKTVYNFSNLTFAKGSTNYGYIAYYADKVYNAPDGSIEGDYIFCKPNNVNTLVCYLGSETELTLPADYKGESYAIGESAFKGNNTITSITIPNSVTSIESGAFRDCSGLKEVHINDIVAWCSINFGGDYANPLYYAHNLYLNNELITELVIPNSVTSIGNYAFESCDGLTSITIPNSVTSIGESAFEDCDGLKTVYNFSNLTFAKGSTNYGYIAYYTNEVYNAPNGSIEGDYIFCKLNNVNTLLYYLGSEAELTLPADYKEESYVIGENVFKDNKTITSIEIPNSVTSIGNGAFSNCTGLKEVHINDLVAWCSIDFGSADANPLYYAKNLFLNGELVTNLSIPAEVTGIKDYAFYNCKGVTNIDIVDKVKSIGNSAFYGCSDLETLYISNTIENIDDYAFAECNNILDIKIGSKKSITASENIFSNDAYNNACLYVPEGRKFAYEKTSPWDNFYIQEMNYTGIEDINAENGNVKAIYDLQGRRIENPTEGIYIVNGKKIFIK